ncbi:MAG: hypothetical protein ACKO5F_07290 [Synechococcus sp.]
MSSLASAANRRALLQTTIAHDANDWHVGRFSLLAAAIEAAGSGLDAAFTLTAQDYPSDREERDRLHQQLGEGHFGQVWLMAPDLDNGPEAAFFEALEAAVGAGTDLVIARDHTDLGASLLSLGGCLASVGQTQTFQRSWPGLPEDNEYTNPSCPGIQTPCVLTGQNGAVQICRKRSEHPLLDFDTLIPSHVLLPAHPHEGVILPNGTSQQVLLSSHSISSGREQNSAILDEAEGRGFILHHSTFHHFADFNLDVRCGAPDFVLDPPAPQVNQSPQLLSDLHAYITRIVQHAMA